MDMTRMIRQQYINQEQNQKVYSDLALSYWANPNLDTITFVVTHEAKLPDSLQIDLHPLINQLIADYGNFNINNIAPEKMMLNKKNKLLTSKFILQY